MEYSRFGTVDEKGRLQPPKPEPRPKKQTPGRRRGSAVSFAVSVVLAVAVSLWAWRTASPESFARAWDGTQRFFSDLRGSVSVRSDSSRPRPGATGEVKVRSSASQKVSRKKEGSAK